MNQRIESTPSGKIQNNVVSPYTFSIGQSISESWARVSGFKSTCLGALLILFLILFGISIIGTLVIYLAVGSLNNTLPVVSASLWFVYFIALLASFPLFYGYNFLGIKRSANLPVKSKMIFEAYHFYWRLLGVLITRYVLITITAFIIIVLTSFCLGLLAAVHTGIGITIAIIINIFAVIFDLFLLYYCFGLVIFSPYLVMDKNVGVFRAFKLSFQGFKQHGVKILITFFIIGILVQLSIIPLGIGLIWTIPLANCLIGVIYRTIFGVTS